MRKKLPFEAKSIVFDRITMSVQFRPIEEGILPKSLHFLQMAVLTKDYVLTLKQAFLTSFRSLFIIGWTRNVLPRFSVEDCSKCCKMAVLISQRAAF